MDLGKKQNIDNTKERERKKKGQTAEGIRKLPAGLQMTTTTDVLAANLGPIVLTVSKWL